MRHAAWLFLVSLAIQVASAFAQIRPLVTEPAAIIDKDVLRIEAGFEFLQDVELRHSGLKGDLTRLGSLGLRYGAGTRVEIGIFWTVRQFLNVDHRFPAPLSSALNFSGNSTSDVGNAVLATKLGLLREGPRRPAISFRFATELPNASTEKGIGVDETNFTAEVLTEKRYRGLRLIGNVGLAILGDPLTPGAQDDLLTYGLATVLPVANDLNLVCDWHGRTGAGGVGTEDQSTVRLGVQIRSGNFHWDGGLLLGLLDTDPKTGVIVGLSYDFDLSGEP